MTNKKQKLELTWIGKDEELKLEPRILIEDPSKSYGDKSSENMLIHGDNLLALKALEQDFAGRIKCIYIDPPYNTGSAFDFFDDHLEHSTWLNLIAPRLKLLHSLLSSDGVIFVQIDYNELFHLKILMDEIFDRRNFLQMVTVKTATPTGFKTANPGPVNVTEQILMYTKDRSKFNWKKTYIPSAWTPEYSNYIVNHEDEPQNWKIESVQQRVLIENEMTLAEFKIKFGKNWKIILDTEMAEFALKNANYVFATFIPQKASGDVLEAVERSKTKDRDSVVSLSRDGKEMSYFLNGRLFSFYKNKLRLIDGTLTPTILLTDLWPDITWNGIGPEGGVKFNNSKKPEKLIQRIVEISTNEGDFVLDSFLGSGTTCATAHKMNRKWIGVELGDQAVTHCLPRLMSAVDGTDQSGISKVIKWKGGGGFKFYNLASSLLRKDSFGNFVIDENYNANMLAAAMCKHEGFKFYPDETLYWKHGKSTETDFIFVTTGFITAEQLDKVHSEMKAGESLLICAKAYAPECENHFANITIKKIPQMILGRCEFGKDNYDLNIIKATEAEAEESNEK